MLSVFGGKITTYRKLAEEVMDQLLPVVPATGSPWRGSWTGTRPLPGGDIDVPAFTRFVESVSGSRPWLSERSARRLARAYGTRLARWLPEQETNCGARLAEGLYEVELAYCANTEWALSADDFLWRRSKLGLHLSTDEKHNVQRWFETNRS
jgi:glycerol-3-phosphate dehydrogenase